MSTEQKIKFFEKTKAIYPRRVWGKYRKIKWAIMIFAFLVYYLAPWLRWDRGPNAPDQAILIDMSNHRAYFFFIEIWPQEVYYFTGLLILAAIGLFFITSMFGRIWCGYFCFQTIWTDLFVWVERIVQGDRNARMKLDKSRWGWNKIWKKFVTHLTWIIISLCTGGAWVFYFNDAPALTEQILHFNVDWSVGSWILALTFSTYLMAGFAREQVCAYMCPYARFQSAMFDNKTLIISYDETRGEPRGSFKKGSSMENRGHCIDCTQCAIVCPMGIDIRDGLQMECIACGLCVDACNNAMDKLNLPRGLIRYDTAHNMEALANGCKTEKFRLLRPRTLFYAAIIIFVSSIMLYSLITRSPVDLSILHDRNPMFVKLSDGSIRNGYSIKILNKTHEDRQYILEVTDRDGNLIEDAKIDIQGATILDANYLPVFADSVGHFRVYVVLPSRLTKENRTEISFHILDTRSDSQAQTNSIFMSGR